MSNGYVYRINCPKSRFLVIRTNVFISSIAWPIGKNSPRASGAAKTIKMIIPIIHAISLMAIAWVIWTLLQCWMNDSVILSLVVIPERDAIDLIANGKLNMFMWRHLIRQTSFERKGVAVWAGVSVLYVLAFYVCVALPSVKGNAKLNRLLEGKVFNFNRSRYRFFLKHAVFEANMIILYTLTKLQVICRRLVKVES